MSASTLAVERTALAWRRTALGAAACALLFTDQVLREGWGPLAVVSLCALVTALLLAALGWWRGHQLRHGRFGSRHGSVAVAVTTTAMTVMGLIAVLGVLVDPNT
ncbi:DUF202 domain-containing protein [Nocardia thailandica]